MTPTSTPTPTLDPDSGELWVAESTFRVLVDHAADPIAAAVRNPDARHQLTLLQSAGIIDGGTVHSALAGPLATVVGPEISRFQLHRSSKVMLGWLSREVGALLLPAGEDGLCRFLHLHPSLLPESLARLVDLSPRPPAPGAEPVPYEEAALAGVRGRWQLSAAWTLSDGRNSGGRLQVLDTDEGMWLLRPGDDKQLVAWPAAPTLVWRLIIRLIMRRDVDEVSP